MSNIVFIQEGYDGPVRIFESKDPHSSFNNLQKVHHKHLFLAAVATETGGYTLRELRDSLNKEHIRSYWFRPSNRLLALMSHLQDHPTELYAYLRVRILGKSTKKPLSGRMPRAESKPSVRSSKKGPKVDKNKVKERIQKEIASGDLKVRSLDDA